MRYVIVSECEGFEWINQNYDVDIYDFTAAINCLIDNGWKLQGGVSSIGTANRAYTIQAMTFEE